MPTQTRIRTADITARAADGDPMAQALAGGRIVATVVSGRTGQHITVQARCRAKTDGKWAACPLADTTHVFIDVPRTGDHGRPNDRVATLYPRNGALWPADRSDPARVWAAMFMLDACAGHVGERASILQGSCCLRCGREPTDPESIEANVGPECRRQATRSQHRRRTAPQAAPEPEPAATAGAPPAAEQAGMTRLEPWQSALTLTGAGL